MSEEYNPQADVLGEIERIEVELKEIMHKRDSSDDPQAKRVLQQQFDELTAKLKHLRARLV